MKLYTEMASPSDDVGLADADIDHFSKSIVESVIREPSQNSNDESVRRPVKIMFNLTSTLVEDIPDIANYKSVIKSCLTVAKQRSATRAEDFFSNAAKILNQESVNILTISDVGTTGAGGKFVEGGKFHTLLVAKGQTNKQDIHSAGSFGLGKNAPIAGSQMRLVFYSSSYEDKGEKHFYCMGKSVLTNWRGQKNTKMRERLFFVGGDGSKLIPCVEQTTIPDWLKKDELGLKVCIVAPRIELVQSWLYGYISSLLCNFFLAIFDGNLEFLLDKGATNITRATMLGMFDNKDVITAAETAGKADYLGWAHICIKGLAADEFKSEIVSIKHLGEFEILIKVAESLPKKVFFIRNGMYITDTLKEFGKD